MAATSYLLVAFDNEREKVPGNARRKTISRGDFQLLSEDIQIDLEVDEIMHHVTGKRSFSITIGGCQHLVMVVDLKRK